VLVLEALALSPLALLLHVLWDDEPVRSNFTVLVWPLTSLLTLLTVTMLARRKILLLILGAPLAFWLAMLIFLHIGSFFGDDPLLFYASDNWTSLTVVLIVVAIAGLFGIGRRIKGSGVP
jgi:hypothetical protein